MLTLLRGKPKQFQHHFGKRGLEANSSSYSFISTQRYQVLKVPNRNRTSLPIPRSRIDDLHYGTSHFGKRVTYRNRKLTKSETQDCRKERSRIYYYGILPSIELHYRLGTEFFFRLLANLGSERQPLLTLCSRRPSKTMQTTNVDTQSRLIRPLRSRSPRQS